MESLKTFVLDKDDFEEAKNAIRDTAEEISGEVPATFTEEVLRRISAAMFADCVAFMETLQQYKEDFSSLLLYTYGRLLQGTARR